MQENVSALFETLTVGQSVFPNRIVMPPMATVRSITGPDGIDWYGRRARGGPGMVIVEATGVPRFERELTAANLKPLVDAIHDGGALAAIQLFAVNTGRSVAPADLSLDDLDAMVAQYVLAAEACLAAGFDGIQPHGAHGYVLNQFFDPAKNQRTDAYGGSEENRTRLALRIVDAVRPVCDRGMLLLWRHTPVGVGYGIDDSLRYAAQLVAHGVDVLDLSPSSIDAPGDRARPFRSLGVPVIAVNELDQGGRAQEVLVTGSADLVAIGRALIADPDWPIKMRDGRQDEIVVCIRCDEACHGNLRRGVPIGCTQW